MNRNHLHCFALAILCFAAIASPAFALNQTPGADVASTEEANAVTSRGILPGLSISLGYTLSTDLAEDKAPRSLTHNLSTNFAYDLGQSFAAFVSVDADYETVGGQIFAESDSASPFLFSALFGAGRDIALGKFLAGDHRGEVSAAFALPVSDDARFEGYRGIPMLNARTSSSYWDGIIRHSNTLSYRYILHSYDMSPVSRRVNTRDQLVFQTALAVPIYRGFGVRGSTSVSFNRKFDGSNDFRTLNGIALTYAKGPVYVALGVENGSLSSDQDLNLFFVDKYRRLATGTVVVSF